MNFFKKITKIENEIFDVDKRHFFVFNYPFKYYEKFNI